MPFEKGNKLAEGLKNSGRKGYEIEAAQLAKMRKIVGMDLKLVEKVYSGKATPEDFIKLGAIKERVQKYLDKLHATKEKSDINLGGKVTFEWKK